MMDGGEDSDGFSSGAEFEALLAAGPPERAGNDPGRAAAPAGAELGKRAKRRRLQKAAPEQDAPPPGTSSGHFRHAEEGRGEASGSRAVAENGGRGSSPQAPAGPGTDLAIRRPGNVATPGPLTFSPEFSSLLKRIFREEIRNVYHQRGLDSNRASSSPTSCPPGYERIGRDSVIQEGSGWPARPARQASSSRKRGRESPQRGPDPSPESDPHDGWGRKFLSDEEEEEEDIVAPEQSFRFFKAEDYQYLLSKSLYALDLRDDPGGEDRASEAPNSRHGPKGKEEFFPRSNTNDEKVFPFPKFFERQLKAEWAEPMAKRRVPRPVKKLYALPSYTNELLQVPLVDGPVAALQSSSLLSEDGQGALKDSLDEKADLALRKAHEALAMAIRASATASIVSRAAIVWTRKLLQLIPGSDRRLNEGGNRLLKAASFTADATLDSLVFSSRAMASAAVARRALWLRAWQADNHSKAIVLAYPFQGDRLFGDALDKILVETRDKKKALPRNLHGGSRRPFGKFSFRSRHTLPRFKQEIRRPNWSQ